MQVSKKSWHYRVFEFMNQDRARRYPSEGVSAPRYVFIVIFAVVFSPLVGSAWLVLNFSDLWNKFFPSIDFVD